ncbi:Thousand and one amino acid protein kinase [Fasciolopsis buskii]|uniref:non-specific serine/threonine protein kinase n=1 Tax=Fasciolopsis buskii TaxID=27845 RepID=A0A8E0RR85_9TREM|nr:Thousand and one amino acid protein kinase [Fasciolopsis buski]
MAQLEPPYFSATNPMAALYQISSNEAPCFTRGDWSDDFRKFLRFVLQKEASKRPFCAQALGHPFCNSVLRSVPVLSEPIQRTKVAVAAQESKVSQKWKRVLYESDFDRSSSIALVDGEHGKIALAANCNPGVVNDSTLNHVDVNSVEVCGSDFESWDAGSTKSVSKTARFLRTSIDNEILKSENPSTGDVAHRWPHTASQNHNRSSKTRAILGKLASHASRGSKLEDLDFYTVHDRPPRVDSSGPAATSTKIQDNVSTENDTSKAASILEASRLAAVSPRLGPDDSGPPLAANHFATLKTSQMICGIGGHAERSGNIAVGVIAAAALGFAHPGGGCAPALWCYQMSELKRF